MFALFSKADTKRKKVDMHTDQVVFRFFSFFLYLAFLNCDVCFYSKRSVMHTGSDGSVHNQNI